MMELHHLPQDYTSSGRKAETKSAKFQQINAINVKNIQRRDSCPKPMNPKGEKLGTCGMEGKKGISSGTP